MKRQFEEFELGDIIGTGTVGSIYRATDLSQGEVRESKYYNMESRGSKYCLPL